MLEQGIFMWWTTVNPVWTFHRIYMFPGRPTSTGSAELTQSSCVSFTTHSTIISFPIRSILLYGSARTLTSATAVSNASTATIESIPASPIIPEIPAIPAIPSIPDTSLATVTEQVASTLEPTFASIGLGGWSPVGILQNGLEFLHISCGLPWWGAIVASTILMRLMVTPLVIIAQRNAARMQEILPKMQAIQVKMTEARLMGNAAEASQAGMELSQFMRNEKVNPLKNMLVPLAQAPIFLSYFIGIRRMVNAPVESLHTGGMLWFSDLTIADPYYMLPLITCSTLFLTIQLGVDGMNLNTSNGHIIKHVVRAMPLVMFPFIMNFPAAMVVYWSTSNFVSLIQVCNAKLIKQEKAKKTDQKFQLISNRLAYWRFRPWENFAKYRPLRNTIHLLCQ